MKSDCARTEKDETGTTADPLLTAELRQRLQASQEQERAARTEARRMARELGLARRLLKFSAGSAPTTPRSPKAAKVAPVRAILLTAEVRHHFDSSRSEQGRCVVTGWAFCPVPEWDARTATVTLIFRDGATAYQAPASRTPRPDVAAHFAAQGEAATGGARGLDGAGFTCEIQADSLPPGVNLEIVLRLECAGVVCEHSTDGRLRL